MGCTHTHTHTHTHTDRETDRQTDTDVKGTSVDTYVWAPTHATRSDPHIHNDRLKSTVVMRITVLSSDLMRTGMGCVHTHTHTHAHTHHMRQISNG